MPGYRVPQQPGIEHTAQSLLNARLLGDPVALTQEETAELRSMQGMYRQLRQVREETP